MKFREFLDKKREVKNIDIISIYVLAICIGMIISNVYNNIYYKNKIENKSCIEILYDNEHKKDAYITYDKGKITKVDIVNRK